jgi:membrane-associated phospholipid phosphatase
MLLLLYPQQRPALDAQLATSLASLSSGRDADRPREIAHGRAYGQRVADAIFAARTTDGFAPNPAPPFVGVVQLGFWRPTLAGATGAGPQFATMTPWVLKRASQFRLGPPLALTSAEYAEDYNETKMWGVAGSSSLRSADQTDLAFFWNGNTALYWNRIAAQVAATRDLSLVDTARLFGLLNVAMADAGVACWDSKYRFVFWRPVTAIHEGESDGNDDTAGDATFAPLLGVTPTHPEYPSGHSTVSGAAAAVLGELLGDNAPFTVDSEVAGSHTRSFPSFAAALAEIHDARVFGGIHFRTACRLGSRLGANVADWVMAHAMTPLGDRRGDQ